MRYSVLAACRLVLGWCVTFAMHSSSDAADLGSIFSHGNELELRQSIDALQSDLATRMGKNTRRRNYACDLMTTPVVTPGPVHVVFVLDPEWLPAALVVIMSLLETSGGACAEHGTYRFHIVVPEEARERVERRLSLRDPSRPLLNNAITVYGFTAQHVEPFFAKLGNSFWNITKATLGKTWHKGNDVQRIQRPANFARFALHEILPPEVQFPFYLDTDFLAVHGPIEGLLDVTSPFKRAYQGAVAALETASREPHEDIFTESTSSLDAELPRLDLSAAVAAVPVQCSVADFVEDFVGYKSPDHGRPGFAELKRWLKGWAESHQRYGGLCFNAGDGDPVHLSSNPWISSSTVLFYIRLS